MTDIQLSEIQARHLGDDDVARLVEEVNTLRTAYVTLRDGIVQLLVAGRIRSEDLPGELRNVSEDCIPPARSTDSKE